MHPILAQTQAEVGEYLSIVKVGVVLVLFVAWCLAVQWVDRDVARINRNRREWWNLLILGAGLGGVAVLILIPWAGAAFFVGLAFWLILSVGTCAAYVVHRNGRVGAGMRVLTTSHLRGLLTGSQDKKARVDKGIRVRLVDAAGNLVGKPADPLELDQFNTVQDFLFDMLWRRVSDVDLLVVNPPRLIYKIDGVVSEHESALTAEDAEKVLVYLKKLAGLVVEEHRRPQKGTIKVALLGATGKPEPLDVRPSGSTKGERLRLRLNRTAGLMRLEDLGFAERALEQYKTLVDREVGLVLFAGPKESGITTTQYATLRAHDAYMQNIYTLETQPLLKLDNVTQQVAGQAETEISFARQLQTVLRREPDVVMVDQCEDRETAQLACRVASEKKIYMAIRGTSALDGLSRLLALVEDPVLVAQALIGVVGQRLLRVLCESCREAYQPDEKLLHKANLPAEQIEYFYRPPSEAILDKKGREIICQTCQNSRYVGRTGTFELLVVSDTIRKLIASGATANQIKGQARTEKMRYLQEDGLRKVMAGTTSMAEVMRGLKANGK